MLYFRLFSGIVTTLFITNVMKGVSSYDGSWVNLPQGNALNSLNPDNKFNVLNLVKLSSSRANDGIQDSTEDGSEITNELLKAKLLAILAKLKEKNRGETISVTRVVNGFEKFVIEVCGKGVSSYDGSWVNLPQGNALNSLNPDNKFNVLNLVKLSSSRANDGIQDSTEDGSEITNELLKAKLLAILAKLKERNRGETISVTRVVNGLEKFVIEVCGKDKTINMMGYLFQLALVLCFSETLAQTSLKEGTPASWSVESQDRKRNHETEPDKLKKYMESFFPSRQLMSLQVFGHQEGTPASWSVESQDRKRNHETEPDKLKKYMESFFPSRQLMSLQVFGHQDAMVMSGWSNIAIVDLKQGQTLASHSLPCQPSSPLVVGDFNNDGLNDIVVPCNIGYLGFSLHHHTNHVYTMLYAGIVFCIILLLSWLCSPKTYFSGDGEDDKDSDDDSNRDSD